MASKKDRERRDKLRRYRRILSGEAAQRADQARQAAMVMVEVARNILKDRDFNKTLRDQNISSVPKLFTLADQTSGRFPDPTLHFAATWAFFYPLLGNAAIANHLERKWPDFRTGIKDAFIALTLGGPFPQPIAIFELNQLMKTCHGGRTDGQQYSRIASEQFRPARKKVIGPSRPA